MRSDICPFSEAPPRLSPDDVAEFSELMRVHTGRRLTPEQAEDEATAFLRLCHAVVHAEIKISSKSIEKLGADEEVR
ncbi:MAG: hypothetical protein PWQ57_2428 [Desulfovibrionales bacterium]|jgi:predicted RNase H-like HicB family nuclease|nr:hypothetical protein [Desulfovibrionales bacterium]